MRPTLCFAVPATIAVAVAVPSSSQNGPPPPPVRYQMDVATTSGIGAGMSGGMSGALGMMMGGGGSRVNRTLSLTIGSSRMVPSPQAEHFFLPTARLGKSVPLSGGRGGEATPESWPGGERPKGRVLLFWGCGAKAGPGQPVVIDFGKIAAGQIPPGLTGGAASPVPQGITSSNSRSLASWPNGRSAKQPGSGSSLLGAHRIASNLGPEISFTLAQDYMGALNATTASMPDGSTMLRWGPLAAATGYAAWTVGGMDRSERGGDIVWWTSSSVRDFGGGMSGWLPPATVATMIARRLVMPPSQTSCQIPAEVKRAGGEMMMTTLNAFGPEADFAYPPRPPAPAPWILEWTAKVRFHSQTMLMTGMDMGGMSGGDGDSDGGGDGEAAAPSAGQKKRACRGPLGIKLPGC